MPYQSLWLSVEQGVHNGMMLDDALFGCARNADAILPSLDQFEFYSGGGIDITFLGMGEMDQRGNVNVSHINGNLIGPGGFWRSPRTPAKWCSAALSTPKVAKLTLLQTACISRSPDKFPNWSPMWKRSPSAPITPARADKRYCISPNARVFQLTAEGVELIEVAPGVNIERDILPYMAFPAIIRQPRPDGQQPVYTNGRKHEPGG
ncbi:bifunctional putative acetyl-CoA:acetoacetyl-CoA transferase: alpha subunit/beta subunit [Klebsiella variicola]|nr:bifunctional putative acetyl-CoA:acetoacetyl-CoA transferase: alpha subunit/beta subunit [Klebsiella variicola]